MLVTEDHERLARSVTAGLPPHGMTVDIALDGDHTLARLGANRYDVVILDRDPPGTGGDDVCPSIVAEHTQGRPVAAEELLERAWDSATDPSTTTVEATVSRLRSKLAQPSIIKTVRDRGYRIGGH